MSYKNYLKSGVSLSRRAREHLRDSARNDELPTESVDETSNVEANENYGIGDESSDIDMNETSDEEAYDLEIESELDDEFDKSDDESDNEFYNESDDDEFYDASDENDG